MRRLLFRRQGDPFQLQWPPCKAHSKKGTFIFTNFFSLLFSATAFAQRTTITGTVVGESNEALIGVTVKDKATQSGVSTDLNGKFSLSVPNGNGTLVVSYVGYETKEVPMNGQTGITVQLKAINSSLQEVVVTGYGTQKRESLTGNRFNYQ